MCVSQGHARDIRDHRANDGIIPITSARGDRPSSAHLGPTRRRASASTSLVSSTSITLPARFTDRDYDVDRLQFLGSVFDLEVETGIIAKTNTQQSARKTQLERQGGGE